MSYSFLKCKVIICLWWQIHLNRLPLSDEANLWIKFSKSNVNETKAIRGCWRSRGSPACSIHQLKQCILLCTCSCFPYWCCHKHPNHLSIQGPSADLSGHRRPLMLGFRKRKKNNKIKISLKEDPKIERHQANQTAYHTKNQQHGSMHFSSFVRRLLEPLWKKKAFHFMESEKI